MRTRSALAAAAVAALALTACDTAAPPETVTTPPEQESTSPAAAEIELPDTPAGQVAAWVLELAAPDATGPTPQETEERFAEEFVSAVGGDVEAVFATQIRPLGPFTVTEVHPGDDLNLTLSLETPTDPLYLAIILDADERITGLQFFPDTSEAAAEITSLPDLDAELAQAGTWQTYVGEISGGVCTALYGTEGVPEGGEPAPSGSVFKLVVLAVVVDAIETGDLTWEDDLVITDELKSLPSGELQNRDSGSTVTVREAADLMISISDNTATDLLIDAVGRDRIEAALPDLGITDPDRLTPFLTTKELFLLGWGAPEVRAQWADADSATRAQLLDRLGDDLSDVDLGAVATDVVYTDGIDWFFTGAEVCAVLAGLVEVSETVAGAPVLDILALNPGGELPEGAQYLGFKGGSVTGEVASAYLIQLDDGSWRASVSHLFAGPEVAATVAAPYLHQAAVLAAEL